MTTKTKLALQWTIVVAVAGLFIATLIWGPWLLEGSRIRDKDGNLVSSAGAIVTGFRTTMVALVAGIIAGLGLRYTHRTLQHTRERDRRQEEFNLESQRTDRYIQLAIQDKSQLALKALDDPELEVVVDTYGSEYSKTQRRQFLFADVQYRTILATYVLGAMPREEFIGQVRILFQNSIFRDYWHATAHHRASLTAHSAEARAGDLIDALVRDIDDADTEEWWLVGEPPSASESGVTPEKPESGAPVVIGLPGPASPDLVAKSVQE